jgi:ppGpp synthetase/RelA/SpoT-type nucleotidyltranferase
VAATPSEPFDFDGHRAKAIEAYQKKISLFEDFSAVVQKILEQALQAQRINVASVQARAKSLASFAEKASLPSEADRNEPRYRDPITEITDLTGARVITFFPRTVGEVDRLLAAEFEILERVDKAAALHEEERLGYQSIHYVVSLRPTRTALPEYARYGGLRAEIQVRTILQHAWAEIEHDIQYKSVETIPSQVRRRFMTLAGLLEIADREFQAVQDEDETLRQAARKSVQAGALAGVEITADALKSYLDKKLGPDGRMKDFAYQYTARLLRRLGFSDFRQIDECVAGFDDDRISRAVWGTRQGQLTRFELLLMASMGEEFVRHHPSGQYEGWADWTLKQLQKLRDQRLKVGSYCTGAREGHA